MMKKTTLKKAFALLAFIFIGTTAFSQVDVAEGAFSALNTSSSGQTDIFNTPTASITNDNFTSAGNFANVLTESEACPRLAQILIPIGEGYKFEVASGYNPIMVNEVRYKFDNGQSNKGGPGNSEWVVEGSNDDATWTTLSSPKEITGVNKAENAIAVSTTVAYRYYRFALSKAWTPTVAYTQLLQLDFTVGAPVPLVDVAVGEFSALNTSSTGQTNIFDTPSASISNSNFTSLNWDRVLTTEDAATPRLKNDAVNPIPVNEGYKFKVAEIYNPIQISEVRYKFSNGASNKGNPGNSEWVVQGSNDDINWDTVSAPREMFTSTSGEITALGVTATQAYRYYRFVMSKEWTSTDAYNSLNQLDFTVVETSLSIKNNEFGQGISIYPNPSNSFLNIKTNANVIIKNIALVDVTGKEVFRQNNTQSIDVRQFSKGLYILKLESQEGAVTSKKVLVN